MTALLRSTLRIPSNTFFPVPVQQDASMLVGELNGLAIDFTETRYFDLDVSLQLWNQVRTAGADVFSSPYTFYSNAGTSPKLVRNSKAGLSGFGHNLFAHSQDITHGYWNSGAPGAVTFTANAIAAPDGTLTAGLVTETVANATHDMYYHGSTRLLIVSGGTYTTSIYAKSNGRNTFYLELDDGGFASGVGVVFDLNAVTATPQAPYGSGYTCVASGIDPVGGGWYRCWAAISTNTIRASAYAGFMSGGNSTYTGDGVSGAYFWGMQLNEGATPLAYTPTTTETIPNSCITWAPHNIFHHSQGSMSSGFGGTAGLTDGFTAPDGTTTASRFLAAATQYRLQTVTIDPGIYTISGWLKSNTGTDQKFQFADGLAFSDNTQVATTTWQRFSFHLRYTSGTISPGIAATSGAGADVLIWGFQFNRGLVATQYVANSGASGNKAGIPISYAEGLWSEPAATNLHTRSQNFTVSPWQVAGATGSKTDNAATAPDGTPTGGQIFTGSGADTTLSSELAPFTVTASTIYTVSIYLKYVDNQWMRFEYIDSSFTNRVRVWFDVLNGVVGTTAGVGAGTYTSSSITSIGNGWYRCTITGTIGTSTSAALQCVAATADNVTTIPASKNWYVWGAQAELGSLATSHIPTVGGTVTRAKDLVTVATSAFPYSGAAHTVYHKATQRDLSTLSFWTLAKTNFAVEAVHDAPASNGISLYNYLNGPDERNARVPVAIGTHQVTSAWAANNAIQHLDGTLGALDTTWTATTGFTELALGYEDGSNVGQINGFLQKLIYVPRRVIDADLPTWRYRP